MCHSSASLLLAIALLAAGPTAAAPPPVETFVAGESGPAVPAPATALAADPLYRYDRLSFATALWADGRGDVILDLELTNLRISDWRSISWRFAWPSAAYSQIRAWDEHGPLVVAIQHQGAAILITPQFRRPVPIGSSYRLSLAITIGGMASGSGERWRAAWGTRPAYPVGAYVERLTLPSNAVVTAAAPTPAARQGNALEWRVANTPPDWSFSLDVAYTLSDKIAVPLFLQRDLPWGDDAYGSYPDGDKLNTVGLWGCYMTAAAMIARYHADRQGAQPVIDPEDLNRWLRVNRRYDVNNFNPLALPAYAQARGVTLTHAAVISGGRTAANDRVIDDYLRSGNPVILKVPAPASPSKIHFVVAVGRAIVDGAPTYAILDPFYGETTLAARYQNSYISIIPFAGTPAEARALSFSGHSPIELLVTDPLGRRAGLDPRTGQLYSEIPGAVYSREALAPAAGERDLPSEEVHNLTIYAPLDGSYSVEVVGTGPGPYTIVSFGADWLGRTSMRAEAGQAALGSSSRIITNYSSGFGLYATYVYLPALRR